MLKTDCRWLVGVIVAMVAGAALPGSAEPLRLAVASNFRTALAAIEDGFPGDFVATYGSSGLLYAQIVQGRQYDVFLSADRARPTALVDAGKARTPVTYAIGRLALLVNEDRPGPAWLSAPGRRVAIANPETAPYGRAAVEALTRLGVSPKRVTALNVAQAFLFSASGAVDGAFVALAQIAARGVPRERYWIVPEELHAPIEQVAVVLKGPNESAAGAFLDYLGSPGTRARIREAGYR